MTQRRVVFLAVLILGLPAAYFGYRLGQVPSDTEIIEAYAAQYVRDMRRDGAAATDCLARPHDDPGVRLVITCVSPDGVSAIFYAGQRGNPVTPPEGPDA